LVNGERVAIPSLALELSREIAVGLGVIRLEPDRFPIRVDRFINPPLASQGNAEVVMQGGVARREIDRRSELAEGAVVVALHVAEKRAEITAGRDVPGIEANDDAIHGNRLVGLTLEGQGVAQVKMKPDIGRHEPDRLTEFPDGAVVVAPHLFEEEAKIAEGL